MWGERGRKLGHVLWQNGMERQSLDPNSVQFSYLGRESHEDFSFIEFSLFLYWCSKLVSQVCKIDKDHDFPSILLTWLLVAGGPDLEKNPLSYIDKNRKVNVHINCCKHTPAGGPVVTGFPNENPDQNQT